MSSSEPSGRKRPPLRERFAERSKSARITAMLAAEPELTTRQVAERLGFALSLARGVVSRKDLEFTRIYDKRKSRTAALLERVQKLERALVRIELRLGELELAAKLKEGKPK